MRTMAKTVPMPMYMSPSFLHLLLCPVSVAAAQSGSTPDLLSRLRRLTSKPRGSPCAES
jgi:hypothetical protein